MNRIVNTLFLAVAFPGSLFAALPQLTSQELVFDSTTREVEVSYVLSGASAVVTAEFFCNGEPFADQVVKTLYGDVNRIVHPSVAAHTFKWNPDNDLPQTFAASSQLTVKLTVWPLDHTPDYIAVDLTTSNNWCFYTSSNAVPGGVTNVRYKTNYLLLRRIPACNQRFRMGSPTTEKGGQNSEAGTVVGEIRHWVTLTKDYYMAVYELTQLQYRHITGGGYGKYQDYDVSDIMPVNSMRYTDLRCGDWPENPSNVGSSTVLAKARNVTGLSTIDMPTDAQWEFACRAGTDTGLNNGTQLNYSNLWSLDYCPNLAVVAWWYGNASTTVKDMIGGTNVTASIHHPVGLKPCNAFGLYDMHGNIRELCLDWYSSGSDYSNGSEVVDPVGPATGTLRVHRGGSVGDNHFSCRSAARDGIGPAIDWSYAGIQNWGVRLSCSADFSFAAESE